MTKQQYYSTHSWKHIRELKLKQQPYCELCQLDNMQTKATQVHHIIKFFDQFDDSVKEMLLLDPDNLCSVCDRHHDAIHKPKRNLLWPFQRYYLDNKKNIISTKYLDQGIIIRWTNDDNRKGH